MHQPQGAGMMVAAILSVCLVVTQQRYAVNAQQERTLGELMAARAIAVASGQNGGLYNTSPLDNPQTTLGRGVALVMSPLVRVLRR